MIFDFDGTMVDSLDSVVDKVHRVVRRFGSRPVTEEWVEHTISGGANSFFSRFRPFRALTDRLIALVQREQGRHLGEFEPVPGLLSVLLLLKKRGYHLGIVSSNTKANVITYLKRKGWETLFEFIYADGEVGDKAALMGIMLNEQRLRPSHVIYIGDEPRDIVAARQVQIDAVGVTWGFQPKKAFAQVTPKWLIDKPDELLAICSGIPWWQRVLGRWW